MGCQRTLRRPHHDAPPRPRLCCVKPVLLDSRLIQPKNAQSRAEKLRWIAALAAAGIREMEGASFVPPAAMPQMADAAEVTRPVRTAHPKLHVVTLAPNLRGAQNATAAGAQSIIMPVSASEAHSQANVRRTRMDQVAEVGRV